MKKKKRRLDSYNGNATMLSRSNSPCVIVDLSRAQDFSDAKQSWRGGNKKCTELYKIYSIYEFFFGTFYLIRIRPEFSLA